MSKYYVYLISDGNSTKIGITNNLKTRISQMQTGNSSNLALKGYIVTSDKKEALELEKELHNTYIDRRVRGEWFAVSYLEVLKNAKNKERYQYIPATGCIVVGDNEVVGSGHAISSEYKPHYFTDRHVPDWITTVGSFNKAESHIIKLIKDVLLVNSPLSTVEDYITIPSNIVEWDSYCRKALMKNYAHLECLGVMRRVKRGTYMMNPYLLVPSKNAEVIYDAWDSMEVGCND